MTGAPPELWAAPPAAVEPPPRRPWFPAAELREAAVVVAVLAVVGALLGIVWQWWSPPGPLAGVLPGHLIQPDETEAMIAADGRYAVIVAAVGLVAGVAVWFRRGLRGPSAALALGVGGLAGSLLTEFVGRALDGGKSDGPVNTLIRHLKLDVHLHGLRVLEPVLAILTYSLIVAFAPTDDLGRADSAEAEGHPQHAGSDRDAPSALQQPQLPPQQWYGQA